MGSRPILKYAFRVCIVLFFAIDAIGQQPAPAFKQPVPVFKQASTVIPFALSDVRLMESPFLEAQRTDAKYILALDEDRLLAPFLKDAGIPPLKPNYGNWESQGLDGHIAGHYLSAVAQMYAATGDTVFLNRLNYMLGWLEKCQERNGNGYVGGIPDSRQLWKEIAAGRVNAVRSRWAPWYNLHKLYSGLVDSYFLTGSSEAKRILVRLTDWCLNLTSGLSDAEMEQMLGEEQGGMNEALANVAYITRDPKYLVLARRFSHRAILRPLMNREDSLTGLHANTQIPKVVGFMRIAQLTGDSSWAHAADFFWKTVTRHRTVVFGGNSVREHFNPTDDFSSMLGSREGPETCNSYNMLKLTRQLFLSNPISSYMDYYERTLYNHILSSQNPKGGFVYFTPIRPGHYRVYSSPQQSFWCCVGTGMENHGKYGELIYAHKDDQLYVNLFIPSVLNWKEKALRLTQQTSFPFSDTTSLTLSLGQSRRLVLKLRCPSWIDGVMSVWVNGRYLNVRPDKDGYLSIDRAWKNKDRIVLHLPMATRAETLPDGSRWAAFLHGPIVLAAPAGTMDLDGLWADSSRWGHIARGKMPPLDQAPILVMDSPSSAEMPRETDSSKLTFSLRITPDDSMRLIPFFQLQEARYILYWPYASRDEIPQIRAARKAKEAAKQQTEAATIDVVYAGEQQPESDHRYKGENSSTGFFKEQHYRTTSAWFSYELNNAGLQGKKISFTYYAADKNRQFDVVVNGQKAGTIDLHRLEDSAFMDYRIDLPAASLGQKTITVMFRAAPGSTTGGIYEVRLLK